MYVRSLRYAFARGSSPRDGILLGQALLKAGSGASQPQVAEILVNADEPSEFIVLLAWANRAAAGPQENDLFMRVGSWAIGQLRERTDKAYETAE